MKKTVLLICVLCMCIGFSVFASPEVDEYSFSTDFLTKLEILLPGDSLCAKEDAEPVSRGEFALLAYRAMGGKVSGDGNTYFYDVEKNSPSFDAVNILAQLGVIRGDGQGIFNPDDNIAVYDALAIMLRLMGYQNPQGMGNELFVSKICSSYDLLDRDDLVFEASDKKTILTLYTKLLSAEVMDIDYIGYTPDVVIDYSVHEDSLLSRYFDIFKEEGILVSNGLVNINGDKADSEMIVVGETSVKTSGAIDLPAGAQVNVYYKDSQSKKFFAAYPDEINEFKTLDFNNLSGLYDGGYEYEEDGRIKKLAVDSKNATYIYNNKLLTASSDKLLLPEYASITFTDSDGNGKYDVVDIRSYISFLVDRVYEEDGIYSVAADDGTVVYIDDEEPCFIKDHLGNALLSSQLGAGVVVSCVAEEKNVDGNVNLYASEIITCDKRVKSAISSVEENNGMADYVFAGDESYRVYPLNEKLHRLISPTDSNVTFCLDFMGCIVDMDFDTSMANVAVGFVIKVGQTDTGMTGNRTIFYMFDELERVREYVFAQKVVIDGVTVKDPVYTDFTHLIGDVILFRVDEKDCIDYIDTAATYSDDIVTTSKDTLIRLADSELCEDAAGMYYNSGCKAFDGCVNIDAYTMILSVPEVLEGADKSEYKILNINDLVGGTRYQVEGYGTNADSVISNIIVIKSIGTVKNNNDIAVVTQVGTALTKDGADTYSLHVFDKTGKHTYPLENEYLLNAYVDAGGDLTANTAKKTVQAGDLVRFKLNENNEIEELVLTYDRSEDVVQDRVEKGTRDLRYYYFYSFRTFTAIPYSINEGFLRIAKPGKDSYTINDFENISFDNIQNVFYVDKIRGKINVTKMAPSAIKTVKNSGTVDSKMIVNFVGQSRVNIFIYDEEVK